MVIKKGSGIDKYIKWFSEISNEDVEIAGGKGASLGEMYGAKFPIPPGFIITAQAYDYFISGIKDKIKSILEGADMEDTDELQKKSNEIRALIEKQEIPNDLKNEILESYRILSSENIDSRGVSNSALSILKSSYEPVFVAIRSSATTEDLAGASFAGQQESFLNVKGDYNLLEKIKKCFSSLYTARAIYYRNKQGFGASDALLACVVMKMIDSEKSGVIFSRSPVGDSNSIVVEAVYGLGEGIVSGQIKPDHYVVSRQLAVKDVNVSEKKIAIVRSGSGQNVLVKLTPERSKSQVLSNGQIIEAANYALRLEEHYQKPQDIEFAVEGNKIYIVQSRPITTLGKEFAKSNISAKAMLEGLGCSPGIGVGAVKIIKSMSDLGKIKKGDVMVTEMTNPDMVVAMEKSVAIITDEGGMTSHAAIVSREMGIPCVVGTGNATKVLKDGMFVTVDGEKGKVYDGKVSETHFAEIKPALKTNRIKLKVIMDIPEFAERAAQSQIDSVGLLRIEGIIASSSKHPLLYEKEKKTEEYCELLRKGINEIMMHFNSIWIRASDIRTDEYSNLKGSPEKEVNPMLGFHGIRFSLKHPAIFEAELSAIKKVAEKYPKKKLGVMFPQVISIEEVREAKKYFDKYKTDNMEFGVMIETPAAVQIIEDICKEGISFISFGTNDLTQYTLAIDRGEENVQYLYNEMHPAVLSQIRRVINTCRQYKVETSICGQAGSKKEMVELLFKYGISSISVNADAAHDISKLILELEEKRDKELAEKNNSKNNNEQKTKINNQQQNQNHQNNQHHQHISQHQHNSQHQHTSQNNQQHHENPKPKIYPILNKANIKIQAEMQEEEEEIERLDKEEEKIDKEIENADSLINSSEESGVSESPAEKKQEKKSNYQFYDEDYKEF